MNRSHSFLAAVLTVCLPFAAQAHRSWLLPSATVLSGNDPWVTVDAAVSNDLFYFEHNAMRLDGLTITAPDGSAVQAENSGKGRYRSSFDLHLTAKGTYKLAVVGQGVMASYTEKGETKRWRGTEETLAKEVPTNAENLQVTRSNNRTEIFVTSGKPTDTVLKTTGMGLELAPITHPNDLFAKETARFRFLLDGKPAADLKVTVIPGGIRYRDKLNEMSLMTDANGEVSVTWPEPGMYWVNASVGGGRPMGEGPGPNSDESQGSAAPKDRPARPAPAASPAPPARRASYSATLEVLAQ